jgi:hypothetical protein
MTEPYLGSKDLNRAIVNRAENLAEELLRRGATALELEPR